MGKLLCDSTTVAETFQTTSPALPWRDPTSTLDGVEAVDLVDQAVTTAGGTAWDDVLGLEDQQRRYLQRLHAKGVLWKPPRNEDDDDDDDDDRDSAPRSVVFRLSHGGEVSPDGNCLFTASQKAMKAAREIDARELRRRTVRRFLEDWGSVSAEEMEKINGAIRHMYSPDLRYGWGIHVVQEVKLLAKKEDRVAFDSAIDELLHLGMQR